MVTEILFSQVEMGGEALSRRIEGATFIGFFTYLSLSLNIPIFAGMSARNSVRKAKNSSLDAQYALQIVRKQLSREYEQALIDYQTSCRQYETAKEQLAYAEEAARMMTEKYNLGKIDFTSWNTVMTELAKAKYGLNSTKCTVILRKKLLGLLVNTHKNHYYHFQNCSASCVIVYLTSPKGV